MGTKTTTMRCPVCRRRTPHTESVGRRQRDPEHPTDRSHDFHSVRYRSLECGRSERRQRFPDLLSDMFHT